MKLKTKVLIVVGFSFLVGILAWDLHILSRFIQPANQVLWMNHAGSWRKINDKPVEKHVCEEVARKLEKDYPYTFFVCIRDGMPPWGTIAL